MITSMVGIDCHRTESTLSRDCSARPAFSSLLLRPGGGARQRARPAVNHREKGGDLLSRLTPREQEVLRVYMELLNDKRIARFLGARPQTIRNHLASIESN